jgi:hypothetical protein
VIGFKASEGIHSMFIWLHVGGSKIHILNYVDDMLYYSTYIAHNFIKTQVFTRDKHFTSED